MANEWSDAVRRKLEADFEAVIESGRPAYEMGQLQLFSSADEEFIEREVARMLHEPLLPAAGERERDWIDKFMKLAKDERWDGSWRAKHAASEFEKLLPLNPRHAGRYYVRHKLAARTNQAEFKWYMQLRDEAGRHEDWDRKWFAQQMLDGLPEAVSNFTMDCLYLLRKADDTTDRLVRLRNVDGEDSGLRSLDSFAFHAPEKFRQWCLERGNFVWSGGRTELDLLHEDIAKAAAWRVINQVVTLGWFPLAQKEGRLMGIWFFGDCAYASGQRLVPDEDGIYWWDADSGISCKGIGEGYLVADEGRENAWLQKRPQLRPEVRASHSGVTLTKRASGEETSQGELASAAEDLAVVRGLFQELNERLVRVIGGLDASLVIGSFAAFAAAPEIFHEYSLFPGLWLHGQAGSGKSTVAEWLMEIWGFSLHNGLILRGNSVTAVGLMQAADQYSNLPVWGDEFRAGEVSEDKIGVLHNGFNRGGQAKFNPSRIQRIMRTNFVVSGESTIADSAMRGRFPHVQVSANRRLGTPEEQKADYRWFVENRKHFYLLGRYLMENRDAFVGHVLRVLREWQLEGVSKRDALVHGVAYASWLALVALLESHEAGELKEFRDWMRLHTREAASDVASDLNINIFWEQFVTAWKANQIPRSCVRVERVGIGLAPGTAQPFWPEYHLFIDPDSTISAMQIYLTKQRTTIPLKRKDLRDQLSKNDYWIQGEPRRRFTPGMVAGTRCWGIELNKHPLGYQPVSDALLLAALDDRYIQSTDFATMQAPPIFKDGDPRKGSLYLIVEDLEREAKAEEAADA